MKVELSRFHVKPGKSARVDEWLAKLNTETDDLEQGLAREQMKLEVIFREVIDGQEYLYWFFVQGEAGEHVRASPFEVDRKHIAFHEDCIDHDYGMRDGQPQAIFVPRAIAQCMGWPDPPAATVAFQRRPLIHRHSSSGEDIICDE